MSALILKDLYIMKKYCRSVLLMVMIFWGASIFADSGNLFWTFFPVIVGSHRRRCCHMTKSSAGTSIAIRCR